ncbi:unnamed protein product [Owenia fusiformis]|uniref:Aminotransferase class I/classII large domain-containing protein n=1 Tax=Owenia fusiformis TaxID=6347 RepID=A0A8S4N349_OWEFU|nr:unnamed protein product [Owenia fusiformis]
MAFRRLWQPALVASGRRGMYKAATKDVPKVEITSKIALPDSTVRNARTMNFAVGFNWTDHKKGDIDYSSCDFLAIGHDRRINEAQAEFILSQIDDGKAAWGKTAVWPRTKDSPMVKFQEAAAEWLNAEAVVLTKSGMDANCGLMEILLSNNDIPVYLDFLAHKTFRYGISAAKGEMIVFKHNNLEDLEAQMAKRGPGFIIVDSLYSSLGTIVPLKDICDLADKYGSALIVDESHGLGAHGDLGNGIVCQQGLEDRVHFRTAGLTKGLASTGGLFTGTKEFIKLFRGNTTKSVFSYAVQDYEAVRLLTALKIVKGATDRRESLHKKFTYLKQKMRDIGYHGYYLDQPSQIFGFCTGDYDNTVGLDRALKSKGIFPTAFTFPAAPRDRSLLRWTVTDQVTMEQLDYTLGVLKQFIDDGTAKPSEWPDYERPCY